MKILKSKIISLLCWSEKYTKTDMVYLLNSAGWVMLGQVTTVITAFVVLVVLSKTLTKEGLGEYRYILSWIALFSFTSLPGLTNAITQSVSKGFRGQLADVVKMRVSWGLLGSLLCFLFAGYYYGVGNTGYGLLFLVSAPFIFLYNSFFTFYFYLQGLKEFNRASIYQMVSRIAFLIVMIIGAYVSGSPVVLVVLFLSMTILGQFWGYWYTNKEDIVCVKNEDPDIFSYGKYMTVVSIPLVVVSQLDKILIGVFLGPIELAIYFVATTLPLETGRIGRMIAQVALPKFSAQERFSLNSLIKRIVMLEFGLLVCWVIYALLAQYFFALVFPDYMDAVTLSIWAMLILLTIPLYIVRMVMVAHKMKKEMNVVLVVVPIFQTILLLIGLYLYGMTGAIFSVVAGAFLEMVLGIYLLWLSSRK